MVIWFVNAIKSRNLYMAKRYSYCTRNNTFTIRHRRKFTGLHDKNGREIYEGDILKGAWDTIFQVFYDDCYLGFRAKEKGGMENCIDYYGIERIEIIGNIHDNPELLKHQEI